MNRLHFSVRNGYAWYIHDLFSMPQQIRCLQCAIWFQNKEQEAEIATFFSN